MEELRPCPFCGGEAEVIDEHDEYLDKWGEPFDEWEFGTSEDWYKAVCCPASNGGCGAISGWRKTEVEAIEAWNTRAERTCKNTFGDDEYDFQCSACGGYALLRYAGMDFLPDGEKPTHCPHCGAEVVGA